MCYGKSITFHIKWPVEVKNNLSPWLVNKSKWYLSHFTSAKNVTEMICDTFDIEQAWNRSDIPHFHIGLVYNRCDRGMGYLFHQLCSICDVKSLIFFLIFFCTFLFCYNTYIYKQEPKWHIYTLYLNGYKAKTKNYVCLKKMSQFCIIYLNGNQTKTKRVKSGLECVQNDNIFTSSTQGYSNIFRVTKKLYIFNIFEHWFAPPQLSATSSLESYE